jgi:hypothetical protein
MSRVEATPALRRDRAPHRVTVAALRVHRCQPHNTASPANPINTGTPTVTTKAHTGSSATRPNTPATTLAPFLAASTAATIGAATSTIDHRFIARPPPRPRPR